MRSVVMYAPGDVRVEDRPEPRLLAPSDAIIRLSATCICGSDLWPYRGADPVTEPLPMGHEYAGVVEEVGEDVAIIRPGQFVIGSFFASDNTCEICRAGYQTSCIHREVLGTSGAAQAERMRVPLADGTRRYPRPATRRSGAQPAGGLRCAGHRLVRCRRRRGRPGQGRCRRR